MTNATITLTASLETTRNQAWHTWQDARTAEEAVWELYGGKNFDHMPAWETARAIKGHTEAAYDHLARACKAAGITTKAEDSND